MDVVVDHNKLVYLKDTIHKLYDESVNSSMYKADMKLHVVELNRLARELEFDILDDEPDEDSDLDKELDTSMFVGDEAKEMLNDFSMELFNHYCKVAAYHVGPRTDLFAEPMLETAMATAGMFATRPVKMAAFNREGLLKAVLEQLGVTEEELLTVLYVCQPMADE